MSIEKALSFQNEADFTSRFLVPLLRRLGYSIVAEYHGQQEFGKDLVFGEIDRFGEVAYHGLQAKYQDSVGQKDSEGLIEDCKQAFRHPFKHPNTGAEHLISTFVVVNAGSITDNARANFFTAMTNAEHGGSIRMFDGRSLLALDRWATLNRVEHVGEVLNGLLIEVRYNQKIMELLLPKIRQCGEDADTTMPIERLRSIAASHYIQKPVLPNHIDTRIVEAYFHFVDCTNRFLDMMCSFGTGENKKSMAQSLLEQCSFAASTGDTLDATLSTAMTSLGPLAAI